MNDYENIFEQHKKAIRVWEYNKDSKLLLRRKKDILVFDSETTSLKFHTPSVLYDDNHRIVNNPFPFGISLCFSHKDRLVLVWGRWGTDLYKACLELLAKDSMKIAHNSKYDKRVCKTNGIEVNGAQLCTLTMSRIYWDRRKSHSLQALSEFICPGISDWEVDLKKELTKLRRQWSKRKDEWNPAWTGPDKEYVNYSFLPDKMIGGYSQTDVFVGWQLFQKLSPYMVDEYADIFDREMAITHVVTKIEEAGMRFDVKRGRAELKKLLPKIKLKRRILDELSPPGFTLGPKKILEALKFLGVKSNQLKVKGKETTGVDTLNQAVRDGVPKRAERFIKVLLDFRAYSKIANTYLKPLTEQAERTGGTVYTTINPTDSRTGRPACISKGTKIQIVRDCGEFPNGINIEDVKVGDLAYCFDAQGNLQLKKVIAVHKTGMRKCVKIKWYKRGNHKTGELICTPEHELKLLNGQWCSAENIKPISISNIHKNIRNKKETTLYSRVFTCALISKKNKNGRMYIYSSDPDYAEYKNTRFVASKIIGDISNKKHVHHINKNNRDDRPENLQILTNSDHQKKHKQPFSNPKIRKKATDTFIKHIKEGKIIFKKGEKHHSYKKWTKDYVLKLYNECGGQITKIIKKYHHNYSTIYREFRRHGIDTKDGRTNHYIVDVIPTKKYDVYNLEVEDYHNFIANELCVHNSRDPNLLNIPRQDVKQRGRQNHVRDCFVPRDDKAIYYFDVAQQEMAMFLSYAGADDILQAYIDGKDLHQYMADLLGRPDKRQIVRTQSFGVIYGLGIRAMAASQNLSIEQAKEEMKIYNNEFPFIRELQLRLEEELRFYGYVQDYFGRRYHVPFGQAYKAVNAIVQGGCAQAFKQGLLQVDELLKKKYPDTDVILCPYDEIQIERKIKKDEKKFCHDIMKAMSEVSELMDVGLKFRVDTARTTTDWAHKEKLKI